VIAAGALRARVPRIGRLAAGAALGWGVVGAVAALFLSGWFAPDGGAPRASARGAAALAPTLLYVALWALVTPPLLLVAERVRFAPPALSARNAARLALLAALVGAAALGLLVAYAAVAVRWADAGSVLNLPEPALFFLGRLRENVLIGALLVAGQLALRHRRAVRARELEAAQMAAQLSESRLQALSMELRPHFLFNTLNAISGMVWADPARADAMVVQLSELLRRTLEAGESPTGTLAEERHVLGLYLEIQQVRFGDRLAVTLDVPDALGAAEVPRFLLQPLVENAFQHGLAPKRGAVALAVRAAREPAPGGDRLVLRVADDGVGLPPDGTLVESTGVGNTRRRLAALYGDDQSLALRRRDGGGTEVVVAIPFRAVEGRAAGGPPRRAPASAAHPAA
jgi:signal transduction histidine kinase